MHRQISQSISWLFVILALMGSKNVVASTEAAYGWSIKASEAEAAAEASQNMRAKLGSSPDFTVVFATSGYDLKKLLTSLRAQLGTKKLFGYTSYRAVYTPDGVHVGPNQSSVAVLGMKTGDFDVGVGVADIPADSLVNISIAREASLNAVVSATHSAFRAAEANAGREKSKGERPSAIFIGTQPGMEEYMLKAVSSLVGNDIPLFGGSSNKNDFANGPVFGNEQFSETGVSVALLYSKKKIGTYFHAGFRGSKHSARVTKMHSPRVIAELDGRPAFDVLNDWSQGAFKAFDLSNKPVILKTASTHHFGRNMGDDRIVSVVPTVARPDKSLELAASLSVGEVVTYIEGPTSLLVERTEYVTNRAKYEAKIKPEDVAAGIQTYCTGASLGVGEKDIVGIVPRINRAMGGKPFIGAFSGGEQGLIPGRGYFQGNLMSSVVVLPR